MEFTSNQIKQLQSLGIEVQKNIKLPQKIKPNKTKSNIFPLLSISGLTLLSFGGLILLKSKTQNTIPNSSDTKNIPSDISPTPTQVPKSIQHYLLTSQQYFSKALQQQNSSTTNESTIELLNQSILAATKAIKDFPKDYRGYQQRGRIYQALIDSKPKLIDQSISDLTSAQKLNPDSAEITHTLASLYAKKGDAQSTIIYLNQTVALEPTKAQNFYDLAKIQQQTGLLPQALETYNRLITLITDSNQKIQIESEKLALENLIAQNTNSSKTSTNEIPSPTISLPSNLDSPTIQALTDNGLIIAAPDKSQNIEITNQTDSNSLSGNSILNANQKEISISNTNLNSTSQVYVTATKGGKNQNLQVISKSENSFIVGLSSPTSEDIEFKWWIIN
jgi:tetratricopeptide (TPR) repeat protein